MQRLITSNVHVLQPVCMWFDVALAASHVFALSCVVSIGVDTDMFEARWVCSFLHEQSSLMTQPDNTTFSQCSENLDWHDPEAKHKH